MWDTGEIYTRNFESCSRKISEEAGCLRLFSLEIVSQ
jgi:hypothetical protein